MYLTSSENGQKNEGEAHNGIVLYVESEKGLENEGKAHNEIMTKCGI